MERVAGFVADGIARSFTERYAHPPTLLQHLTHDL